MLEFLRNDKLDSRNTFAAVRAPFRFNQFGAAVGGPVTLPKLYDGRNKTFFMTSSYLSPEICFRRSSETPSVSM